MSKRVIALVLAALIIGTLGDLLLRPTPWGIGAFLWISLSTGVAVAFTRSTAQERFPGFVVLLGCAVFFAASVAWRDAVRLKGWNVLAVITVLTLGLTQIRGLQLRVAKTLDYLSGVVTAGIGMVTGPIFLALDDLPNQALPQTQTARALKGVLFGLLISIPILILFAALLVSADPVFEQLTRRLFDWDIERLVSHVLVIGFLSWIATGYLRTATVHDDRIMEIHPPDRHPTLGTLEVGIPLGALAVLFLSFVVVQVRYLFGGEEIIRATIDLTYAEYARRGFFELIALCGLMLPLLMVAQWMIDSSRLATVRVIRVLSVVLLSLVALIMVSAVERLRLYHGAYGLSESRFYAAAVMAWIAAALAWFGLTVLRGRSDRFVFGAVIAGLLVVATLNFANPDAIIVRANLARGMEGKELDVAYLESLSADATPILVSALPDLASDVRCAIAQHLEEEGAQRSGSSWRSWSLGRSRADGTAMEVAAVLQHCRQDTPPTQIEN